ncbi:DUF4234 domain-containing protein [Chloroflexota bacterium]
MKHRDPVMVAVLSVVTIGIYVIVWYVKTKNEMNAMGANIPTAWLIIIPFINLYWLWKYCEGLETVTNKRLTGGTYFLIMFLAGYLGFVASIVVVSITQNSLNKITVTK